MAHLAFLGLGGMGRPMARHLVAAGHDVVVYNRTPAATGELVALGARSAPTPAAAATGAEIAFVCVTDDEAVRAILTGRDGVLAGLRPGATVIDHSTITPGTSTAMAAAAAALGIGFLDAPVSGGTAGAEAGTLTVMVGGDAAVLDRVRPVLENYARVVHHLGPSGAGSLAKLVNQYLTIVHVVAAADALALAARGGLDLAQLGSVLSTSFGQSRMLDRAVTDVIVPRRWESGFRIDIIAKDARLIAEALDTRTDLIEAAAAVLRRAQADGDGRLDGASTFLTLGGGERTGPIEDGVP